MKRFVALLNDSSYINITADEMKYEGEYVFAYDNGYLVAMLDISVVLTAYIREVSDNERIKHF